MCGSNIFYDDPYCSSDPIFDSEFLPNVTFLCFSAIEYDPFVYKFSSKSSFRLAGFCYGSENEKKKANAQRDHYFQVVFVF
jgi:hypothetical protein